MGLISKKTEKKEETKKFDKTSFKKELKYLVHVLDALEFASARNDDKLREAYEKEAIKCLLALKNTYGPELGKLIL